MPEFIPGQRYPLTLAEARPVLWHGWPLVRGKPDLTRGRRFVKAPCDWEFWLTDGRKVSFSHSPQGTIVSVSRQPDPDLPDPL